MCSIMICLILAEVKLGGIFGLMRKKISVQISYSAKFEVCCETFELTSIQTSYQKYRLGNFNFLLDID